MSYGMYLSAAGANAQSQRLEILSHNLANVDTTGFKREIAVLQARHAEAIEQGLDAAGSGSLNDLGGGVGLAETITDFAPGILKRTGVPTDLALEGEGFFVVEQDGDQFLTRAGNFQFSTDGRLLSSQGYPVLSADGTPIQIDPALPSRFLEFGAIEQAGALIPLAIVRPESPADLARHGENLFHPLAPVRPVDPADRRMISGSVEVSSVKPALEMMELIETSRAYESNVRMIQNHDQMVGSLFNRLLRQG